MYRSPIILLTSYLRGVSPRIRFRHFHLASFRLPSALISDLLFSFRFLNYRFDLIEAFIRTSAKGKKDRLRVGERGMGTIDQIQINFQWLCFDPFVIPAMFAEKIYIYVRWTEFTWTVRRSFQGTTNSTNHKWRNDIITDLYLYI